MMPIAGSLSAHAAASDRTPPAAAPALPMSAAPGLDQELAALLAVPGAQVALVGERGTGRSHALDTLAGANAATHVVHRISLAGHDAALAGDVLGPDARTSAEAASIARRLADSGDSVLVLVDDFQVGSDADIARIEDVLAELRGMAARVKVVIATTPARPVRREDVALVHLPRMSLARTAGIIRAALAAADTGIEDEALRALAGLAHGLPGHANALAGLAAGHVRRHPGRCVAVADLPAVADAARVAIEPALRDAWSQATIRARRGIFPEILLGCALSAHLADGSFHVNDVRATLEASLHREVRGLTNQISVLAESSRGRVLEKVAPAPNARYRFLDARLEACALLLPFEGREIMRVPEWLAATAAGVVAGEGWREAA